MERIASSSLDFLITSAVATVDVSAVAVDIAPLLILCTCGFIWNFVMLGFFSRLLLPNHWYDYQEIKTEKRNCRVLLYISYFVQESFHSPDKKAMRNIVSHPVAINGNAIFLTSDYLNVLETKSRE